ncbi:diacylglycerol O-acyltransferase 3 [Euphorbia lathyris]|uniref:diacylglycerol O-acyltransferase 3 n=1 Tax=Euphorbia lathyris TaxID=212925 RepID=UPI003313BFAE
METTARMISSPVIRFSGIGDDVRSLKLPFRQQGNFQVCFSAPRDNTGILSSQFSDSGHMQYYQPPITRSEKKQKEKVKVMETEKKKMKLIKRLRKDLNFFSQTVESQGLGSQLMGEVKGKMMSEATEILLAELESMRTEQKEQKRKRKEEKAKAKLMKSKAMVSESSSSSSSSSESSDCDGDKKAIDMRSLRENAQQQQLTENEAEQGRLGETSAEAQKIVSTTTSSFNLPEFSSINSESVSNTKIEICMGGKCKKLGAPMLMEEFERKIGTEGSVVGCKCMGKCKSAPNVRVSEIQEESVKCSLQTPTNPLYIGVGLEDVGVIVANLLGKNWNDNSLLAAA